MNPILFSLLVTLLFAGARFDEEEAPSDPILSDDVADHVDVLASDLFEGRHAGMKGERRAAGYIVSLLEEYDAIEPGGEEGTWFQSFDVQIPTEEGGRETAAARNVIALLRGSDPDLADEFIVIGAHYDHVGYGRSGNALDLVESIHNGADDNASGSSAVLELAAAFATSPTKPRRSLLFQWYSGEELGLIGSKYYAANPLHSLDDTIFMLNMDMVGRLTGRTLLVGGTGSSPGFADMVESLAPDLNLKLKLDPSGSAPSDNTSFYAKKIPVLFLFTGLHDDYHQATDDPHLVNMDGVADIAKLAYGVVRAVDALEERPEFVLAPGDAEMWRPVPYLGVEFLDSDEGVEVAVVVPGFPASLAGIEEGDLVLSIDGTEVVNAATLRAAVKRLAPEIPPIELVVLKGGKEGDENRRTLTIQAIVR